MSVDHVFVLMLENRSFDQMLGLSGIEGTDALTGGATRIEGLLGTEDNPAPGGGSVRVSSPAEFVSAADPGHEFPDVREQLCGGEGDFTVPAPAPGSLDPRINCSGFVSSFAGKYPTADWRTPMKCFTPGQLPVLTALAKEFAVCDHWFSSLPGPTWPNRFFVHAASSGGLDHSPNLLEELGVPYSFSNGTVFDLLDKEKLQWAVYMGDEFPQALHMDGMMEGLAEGKFKPFSMFAQDLNGKPFPEAYVFIEPDWHPFTKFKGGNSQHPVDDVTRGDRLIKDTYEAIRNSPVWESSLLIITYDEHGGFYDHVPPPTTVEPADVSTGQYNNKYGFGFKQLGVRVPAVVVSPLVGKGIVDHRVYEHSSVPATIEGLFGLRAMTQRDKRAASVVSLLTLGNPREDAPTTLPPPAPSGTRFEFLSRLESDFEKVLEELRLEAGRPVDPSLAGFVHVALMRSLSVSNEDRDTVIAKAKAVKSDSDALRYIHKVRSSIPKTTRR